jgi:predicted negative regulator of RcsB-dependent stress response
VRSYTRRQLKQDQFKEAAAETVHWASEHRIKLVWGGGVAVLVVAAIVGTWFYYAYRERHANRALGDAMITYYAPLKSEATPEQPATGQQTFATAQDRAKAAYGQFTRVADEYSSVRSGKLARYFSGVTAVELGDNKDAESDLQSVISSADPDLASLAKLALANLYRKTNRQADAVKLYNELIQNPTRTVSKPAAQLELAELFAATQPAQARTIYQQIAQENPDGAAAQVAQARLQDLK